MKATQTRNWRTAGGELWCPDDLVVFDDSEENDNPVIYVKPPYGWDDSGVARDAALLGNECMNATMVAIADSIAATLNDGSSDFTRILRESAAAHNLIGAVDYDGDTYVLHLWEDKTVATLRPVRIQLEDADEDIIIDAYRDDSAGTWSGGIMGLYLRPDQYASGVRDSLLPEDLCEEVMVNGEMYYDISAIVAWEVNGAMSEVNTFWESKGFEEISTGGGCTAFSREYREGYVLITNDDASVPSSLNEHVTVGFYDNDQGDGGPLVYFYAQSSGVAFGIIDACGWTNA